MRKLFRKLSAVICAGAIACTAFAFSAFADDNEDGRCWVYGNAISSSDEAECEKKLDEASDKYGIEFFAVFINDKTYSDSSVEAYANHLSYKYTDCAVMVNNSATRYTYVARTGDKTKRVSSSKATKITKNYINTELKDNDYVSAVQGFIKGIRRYSSFLSLGVILIGLLGFAIFFLIMYFAVKAKYKFHEKPNTGAYLEGGDLSYDVMMDTFVSEHTTRTAINTGSGGGGGGGSHSGGGSHY